MLKQIIFPVLLISFVDRFRHPLQVVWNEYLEMSTGILYIRTRGMSNGQVNAILQQIVFELNEFFTSLYQITAFNEIPRKTKHSRQVSWTAG